MRYTDFVEMIVKGIVQYPEDVKLDVVADDMGVLITIHANPTDIGCIIGKAGNTAKSIRSLARIAGIREEAKVSIKIVDPRKD